MAFVITTTSEVAAKMGANISVGFTAAMQEAAEQQIMALINCITKKNYTDLIAADSINVDVKGIFSDTVSSYIAMQGIKYDMSGYTDRIEAEDMLTIERDTMLRGLGIIKQQAAQDFIDGA